MEAEAEAGVEQEELLQPLAPEVEELLALEPLVPEVEKLLALQPLAPGAGAEAVELLLRPPLSL